MLKIAAIFEEELSLMKRLRPKIGEGFKNFMEDVRGMARDESAKAAAERIRKENIRNKKKRLYKHADYYRGTKVVYRVTPADKIKALSELRNLKSSKMMQESQEEIQKYSPISGIGTQQRSNIGSWR